MAKTSGVLNAVKSNTQKSTSPFTGVGAGIGAGIGTGAGATTKSSSISSPSPVQNPTIGSTIGAGANFGVGTNNTQSQPDQSALIAQLMAQLNAQKQQSSVDIAGMLKQYQAPTPVDNSGLINQQYSGALQQLKDAIAASKAKLPSVYDSQRTQANVAWAVGALGDQERLASQGLANSGEAESSRIARQTGVGNVVNALTLQQNQANADLDTQLNNGISQNQVDLAQALAQNNTDLYNQKAQQYQNNIANALAASELQNTVDSTKFNQGIAQAGITGLYNGNQTLDALNSDRNFALNQAGVTGNYNGAPTMASQSQTFDQNMAKQQFNQAKKQQDLDNLYRQQTFDYQKLRDTAADTQWQQQMNLNLRQQSFQEAQQKIENALSQRRISQSDADQALQWARFNADQDPNSIDNKLKKQQLDMNSQSKTAAQVNSIIDNYNNLYVTRKYDKDTGITTTSPDTKSILDALHASNKSGEMSDDMAKQIAGYYGLNLPDKKK